MPRVPDNLVTEIPMRFRRHAGKTVMINPDGTRVVEQAEARIDDTLIKVVVRAFRWEAFLRNGTYATMADIGEAEKISPSFIGRVIRITLLSPEIIEAILDGNQPPSLTTRILIDPFPLLWDEQLKFFGFAER